MPIPAKKGYLDSHNKVASLNQLEHLHGTQYNPVTDTSNVAIIWDNHEQIVRKITANTLKIITKNKRKARYTSL